MVLWLLALALAALVLVPVIGTAMTGGRLWKWSLAAIALVAMLSLGNARVAALADRKVMADHAGLERRLAEATLDPDPRFRRQACRIERIWWVYRWQSCFVRSGTAPNGQPAFAYSYHAPRLLAGAESYYFKATELGRRIAQVTIDKEIYRIVNRPP